MKTLLIVDDERNCLSLYKREFSEEGYRVLTAADGRSGLRMAQDHDPDCVVVDLRLPDIDGLSLMQGILAQNPKTPIVINSAYHDAKDDFASWCARAYVVKSSDLEELKRAVGNVLREQEVGAG